MNSDFYVANYKTVGDYFQPYMFLDSRIRQFLSKVMYV